MSIAGTLAALAAGDGTAVRAVLHNCRTAGFGAVGYGREETAALFRAAPLTLDAGKAVVTDALVALPGHDAQGCDAALFADVHDGHVVRLWALGPVGLPSQTVDETAVPVDLDLDQRGGRFDMLEAEHPGLDPDAAVLIRRLGDEWLVEQPREVVGEVERARPILLRAASAGERSAMLFMLQGFAGASGLVRFAAGAFLGEGDVRIVVDEAGRAAAARRRRVVDLRPRDDLHPAASVTA